jgi:hypothetical protein
MEETTLPSKEYTWDKMYNDEYAKGKNLVHDDKPDEFVIWTGKYLKEKRVWSSFSFLTPDVERFIETLTLCLSQTKGIDQNGKD